MLIGRQSIQWQKCEAKQRSTRQRSYFTESRLLWQRYGPGNDFRVQLGASATRMRSSIVPMAGADAGRSGVAKTPTELIVGADLDLGHYAAADDVTIVLWSNSSMEMALG